MIFIDFEFSKPQEKDPILVCASLVTSSGEKRTYWLFKDDVETHLFREDLEYFVKVKKEVICSYNYIAETRCLLAMGLEEFYFYPAIDLFLEWRCLTNHNDKLLYNCKQLIDGKEKFCRKPPPKWERTEEDSKTYFSPIHSLAEAVYRLNGKILDTEHKNKMRDLVISSPSDYSEEEKAALMEYCLSDSLCLPDLYESIVVQYKGLLKEHYNERQLLQEMHLRAKYSFLTGIRERLGYPVDIEKTKNFSDNVPHILNACRRDINSQFPGKGPFKFKRKTLEFSWDQNKTREWISTLNKKWMKTDTGKDSLSLEAFEQHFPFKHDYPRENLGAQIVRYLKLKQALNGFTPSKKSKSFWDYVGSDGMVRPYMNIYKAQSSRSQPASSGFMFLKPAWVRSLVVPPKGYAICGIDYSSQEFLISGLLSNDKNMIDAYKSGDVYLFFGKKAKAIPEEGTKETHSKQRDLFKGVCLGLAFQMSKFGLSSHLTNILGHEVSEEEAQSFIDDFESVFETHTNWKQDLLEDYNSGISNFLKLPCGWYMWGDNENFRSVGNYLVQGSAASIMRTADRLCYEAGLRIIFTLHDALYLMYPIGQEHLIDTLISNMKVAFSLNINHPDSSAIRMEGKAWSPEFVPEMKSFNTPGGFKIESSQLHIDKRAKTDYEKFSPFFMDQNF